jgi:hypothetical protein
LPFFSGMMASMSDDEDDPLEKKFKATCNAAIGTSDEWMVCPTGDTDFEKGIRRGIELVLLTIRDRHGPIDLYPQDDDSYHIDILLWDDMSFTQDFAKTIQSAIDWVKGEDDAIRRLSAYLRAQADEVDKAIGFEWSSHRKKEALEEEP